MISLILFPFNAINSWHSPWKLTRAIYNIYGITQYFYWNTESLQRTALKPQTAKWFHYVTLCSWWQAFTNSPFTNAAIKLKIAAQQTKLMGTEAGLMGSSLLSYRSLGFRQDAALEAALPSSPSLFRDGDCHPQSWTDEKREEFELLQGAVLEASLKCARKQDSWWDQRCGPELPGNPPVRTS